MKTFNLQSNIGRAKYVVNFHDGSKFFDIQITNNKKELKQITDNLIKGGYIRS